jgi:hypothetical protein
MPPVETVRGPVDVDDPGTLVDDPRRDSAAA